MKDPIDYKILKNFAGGRYSLKEFKLITRWFDSKEYEAELKETIGQHWKEFQVGSDENMKDLSIIFNQLKQKIRQEKPAIQLKARILRIYSSFAAILLVPLFLYSVYSTFLFSNESAKPAWIEIISPQGARTQFQLPDGTKGWLNSGTHLKYASNFENDRHVELAGEAWFEVVHNMDKPFVVSTPMLDVQVLGTKFNVTALPSETVTEVVLQEGKVNVISTDVAFSDEMKPNEKFTYNKKLRTINIQTVNAEQFIAWKDGLLIFRNEPLSEVLNRIGRWYNVRFVIEDPELVKFRYRATFQEEQVEEVIRLIALTVPIEYEIERRTIGGNGAFEQRSIVIRKKKN